MTQSGISQHVSRLEEQLGVSLFLRSSKATVPTDAGKILLDYIRTYNDSIAMLMDNIQSEQHTIEGLVSYAMPPGCLLSPHFPMLLARRCDYPELELRVELLPNEQIMPLVIDGKFDFGFVTEKVEHPLLCHQAFCYEEYIMIGADEKIINDLNHDNLLHQRYISYPGMGVYFNYWLRHFLPEQQDITDRSLHHAGEINNIEGAIHMVVGALGISVFPRHCVQQHLDEGRLFAYQREGKDRLLNNIHIVTRNSPNPPARVSTVIQWFMDMRTAA